jgi:site-specific DNA-cytosine methylase
MPPIKVKEPTAIGAYIFAGGFTLGVSKFFKVLCHLEDSDYGVKTAQRNFPDLPIYVGSEHWPDKLEADFVYGNPPCAAWSVAGYTKDKGTDKWLSDPRVACTEKHFSLLGRTRPKVWAWESVTQAFSKGRLFVKRLEQEASRLGYSTSYLLHNSQYLGLPQVRKRFFMVCHRVKFFPVEPDWKMNVTPVSVLKNVKAGEETHYGKEGTRFANRYNPLLPKVRPGQRLVRAWEENIAGNDPELWERNKNGTITGRPSFGHCRLPLDRPGGAIVGYGVIHPIEHRFLTTEEIQVLCGFPSSFVFTPKTTQARASEIARGVCPPVGAWLARAVHRAVMENERVEKPQVVVHNLLKPPGVR